MRLLTGFSQPLLQEEPTRFKVPSGLVISAKSVYQVKYADETLLMVDGKRYEILDK